MKTFKDALSKNMIGIYYGNRVLLPFHCHILKIVIENNIITDFSPNNKGAFINEYPEYTEIYFLDYPDLEEKITKYEVIKMVIVEKNEDLFDFNKHLKISLHLDENHRLLIKEIDENTILID
jgi:hypothetical protein